MPAARGVAVTAAAVTATAIGVGAFAATVMLTTPPGAEWAVHALDAWLPAELGVARVEGSVLAGLRLVGLRFEGSGVRVEVERAEIEPLWSALRRGRLVLERLAIRGGRVDVAGRDDAGPPASSAPGLPAFPDWLEIRALSAAAVAVNVAGTAVAVERMDAAVARATVALEAAVLRSGRASLALATRVDLAAATARGIEAVLTWTDEQAPAAPPQQVILQGTAQFALDGRWRADAWWSQLRWRRSAEREWTSPSGRVTVTLGAPTHVVAEARVDGPGLPAAVDFTATAEVDGPVLDVLTVEAHGFDARLAAHGAVDVRSRAGFLAAEVDGVDPGRFDERLHGLLGVRAYVALAEADTLRVGASATLFGRLGPRLLDGEVALRYVGGTLDIHAGSITLGDGRLEAAGTVSPDASDLRLEAMLPRLEDWHPAAAGALAAVTRVQGTTRDPTIALDLDGRALSWAGTPLPPLDVTASVAGTLASHHVRINVVAGDAIDARLATRQGMTGRGVSGTLLESAVRTARAGVWTLGAPAAFAVNETVLALETACYRGGGGGELCLRVADKQLEAVAREVPAALAGPWLPEDVSLAGSASGRLELDWRNAMSGSIELSQPALVVSANGEDGGEIAEVTEIELTGSLDGEALGATLSARFAPTNGALDGRLRLTPPSGGGALDAELTARADDLAALGPLLPGVENLRGHVEARFQAGGTAAAPTLRGELAARSLGATLPNLGTTIEDGQATVTAGPEGLVIHGELCSGGCVDIGGELSFAAAGERRLDARLTGSGFRLLDTGRYGATISPELAVAASPEGARVTGTLRVDEGSLSIEELPEAAVRPAPETIVHDGGAETADDQRLPIVLDVNAALGDVRFAGFGIDAELGGELDVESTPAGALLVRGTATVEQGRFRAYGQELVIERGLLTFTGAPENPSLDIVATRRTEDARVGLTIRGTARSPRSEIFSEPALSESEALARLLTGRSLDDADSLDENDLELAAVRLGLRSAFPALGRLGEGVGLDELAVEPSSDAEGGALVAGKRLGEDVYLRYRRGLFDDFVALDLIYRIGDHFQLRTETGTAQAIDVIYDVNRDEAAGPAIPPAGAGPGEGQSPADVATSPRP